MRKIYDLGVTKMLFLVATKETQGKRKSDFSWTTDGEPVMYGAEGDGEKVDGK